MPRDKNIFTLNPTSLDMKRSVFKRVSQHKTSFNLGELIPVYFDEILPGDTVKFRLADLVRMMTPIAPIMDNIFMDVYAFFVPNRLVWDNWQSFCGENKNGPWADNQKYTIPVQNCGATAGSPVSLGSIGEYLGLPVTKRSELIADVVVPDALRVSELPLRAYFRIYNEWFRNENISSPIPVTFGDNYNSSTLVRYGAKPAKVSRFHDYFSSALPAPQKGASITLPLGATAPIIGADEQHLIGENGIKFGLEQDAEGISVVPFLKSVGTDSHVLRASDQLDPTGGTESYEGYAVDTTNLIADLSEATNVTVNQLRLAFQLQKLLEKDARGGTRYIELLKSHFGVTSPDARLQRTEYLAGERFRINIDQIVATADSGGAGSSIVGQTGAMSKTSGSVDLFTKSFVEHGILMVMCCIRHDHTYSGMLEKYWLKSERFDFYYPVLANIGEQPIKKYEIDIGAAVDIEQGTNNVLLDVNRVFGYQEAWAEYRFKPSRVSGYMNPRNKNALNYWNLADVYVSNGLGEEVGLNETFMLESPDFLDRALSVTSSTTHQFIADFYFDATFSRIMPLYSVPGLIDHH